MKNMVRSLSEAGWRCPKMGTVIKDGRSLPGPVSPAELRERHPYHFYWESIYYFDRKRIYVRPVKYKSTRQEDVFPT